jgi:O-antigen/teichoic acid export membrane protein
VTPIAADRRASSSVAAVDASTLSYRRLAANALAGAGGRIAAIAVALILATVLVRRLGLETYGTWAFFFVLIGYHGQFDLGLSVAVERSVARAAGRGETARLGVFLNAGIAMSVLLSLALAAVALLPLPDAWLARLGDPGVVRGCLRVMPVCLLCSNVAAVAGAGLTGLQRTTTVALQRSVMGAATALVVIGLAIAGERRLDVLLVAYAAGLLATAGLSWRAVRTDAPGLRFAPWRVSGEAIRELAVVGGALQATHFVAQAGDQAMRVVLGSAHGAAAIGLYDLASRAAIAPRSLMASLLVALVPFAAAREGHGRIALSESLQRATRYATLAIAAGTVAGFFVAQPLMALWLGGGPGVREAQRMLEWLLVALAIQSVTSPMVAMARAAGRPGAESIGAAIAQPLGVAAAMWSPSLVAAVAAHAAVTTAAGLGLWWWLKRALGLDALPWRDVAALGATSAGAVAAAAAARAAADGWQLGPWPTMAAVAAATVGALVPLALATGAVSPDEQRVLVRLGRRPDVPAARR